MSSLPHAVVDSTTMLRRNLRRTLRYPVAAAATIGIPLVLLLLFVGVFGDTMGAGLVGASGGRDDYLDYITPGILLISVAMDMTEGIINRFRTMAITRASVLTGHALGNLIQTLVALVVVVGVALLLGFDPSAMAIEWLAVIGLLTLTSLAVIWLAIALGQVSRNVEAASNLPLPLILLPFLGSGFVPTDGLPAGMDWFAEHQPFTPIMETIRGLLLGSAIGSDGIIAVAWSVGILVVGYLGAKRLYERDPAP